MDTNYKKGKTITTSDGTIMTTFDGKLHNWEGPSVIPQGNEKLAEYYINGIKMTENSYDLLSNGEKLKNCQSKEYHLYYKRIVNSLKQIADLDCKLVWEYSESISKDRWNYCFTHYSDDVKKEITLISLNSAELYKNLNECVYKDSIITSMLKKSYLMKCKI